MPSAMRHRQLLTLVRSIVPRIVYNRHTSWMMPLAPSGLRPDIVYQMRKSFQLDTAQALYFWNMCTFRYENLYCLMDAPGNKLDMPGFS
jgi:hypothetical protein